MADWEVSQLDIQLAEENQIYGLLLKFMLDEVSAIYFNDEGADQMDLM
jgi:hypothetical protein